MRRPLIPLLTAAALELVLGRSLLAQCPDGSPPPCRATQVASAVRRDPPLDDRVWLVVPFDNLARDPALDVIKDGSVTLLYGEMSRWSDIRVIDDTRVADLMQTVPAAPRLGQEVAFGLARRVGAGRLVMGTVLREGARTRVDVAVFDVRARQRLRSVRDATTGTDSLSTMFGRLAQGVLQLPDPGGAGTTGTASTEALRAYVNGVSAERRALADSAAHSYERAVRLDSAFAMAHFRLWMNLVVVPGEGARAGRHLAVAVRLSDDLPLRERTYIAGTAAAARGDVAGACALFDRLMAADSLDAWAWWARGNCLGFLAGGAGAMRQGGQIRFTADVNGQLRAWQRAVELDVTLGQPFGSIMNTLTSTYRSACAAGSGASCPDTLWFVSPILLDRDTLVYAPRPWGDVLRTWYSDFEDYVARRTRFALARDLARRYVVANPGSWLGHYWLAFSSLALGDLDAAERELAATSTAARFAGIRRLYHLRRLELELMRERPERAAALLDTVYLDSSAAAQPAIASLFGRFSLDVPVAGRVDSVVALRLAWLPAFAGILGPDFDQLSARYATAAAAQAPTRFRSVVQAVVLELSTLASFRLRGARPATDTVAPHPVQRFQARLALGDTVLARAELATLDALLSRRPPDAVDDGAWIFAAEAHLMLGDSAAALARLRDFAGRWSRFFPNHTLLLGVRPETGVGNSSIRFYGRSWLLTGDLAMAVGDRDLARRAYRMVVGLWQGGEAPVQLMVARARVALSRLGT